jgi:2-dehydro-3-deoxyphosphogluconate aldolase/(4S)-4-hydroxy-2-oxoglutarate aldolase
MSIVDRFRQHRIVPVIVIDDAKQAPSLSGALIAGGLPIAEVTFRTAGAADAIKRIADAHPTMVLGAGTVLTPAKVDEALAAGAKFIVAPGLSAAVVERCKERDVPVFPGVCTPTELEAALSHGLTTLKFFPAEPMGGVPFLKAMSAPYVGVSFIPTGGISAANLKDYLGMKQVIACGGSWMAPAEWTAAGQFDRIRAATADAVALANGASR